MSTLSADSGVRGFYPSLVGGAGSGIFTFPSVLGPSFNDGGNALANASKAVKPAAVTLRAPQFEGQVVTVRQVGYVTTGTSETVAIKLYVGSSLTASSNELIVTGTSASLGAGTFPYYVETTISFANGSYQVGPVVMYVAGAAVTATIETGTTSPPATGLYSFNAKTADLELVTGVQFGSSDAGNVAALESFSAEN